MNRGDVYLVANPEAGDPRSRRPVVVVSRQGLIRSGHSSVTCAFVGSTIHGLKTEVQIGPEEGLKNLSAIQCDTLMNINKRLLTNFLGSLGPAKTNELNVALAIALGLP